MKTCEKNRKLLHIVSGITIPLAIVFLPHLVVVLGLSIASILYSVIELLRINCFSFQKIFNKFCGIFLRQEEKEKLTGSSWIIFSALFCALFFQKEIAALVMTLSIWGDAIAAIAGQKLGRIKIGKKTLEGSVACFTLCVLLLVFIFPALLKIEFSWLFIVIIALTVTILEFISDFFPLDDNLVIPIITGIIITLFF